jgi:hypothetical protein
MPTGRRFNRLVAQVARPLAWLEGCQVQPDQSVNATGKGRVVAKGKKLHSARFDQIDILPVQHGLADTQRIEMLFQLAHACGRIQSLACLLHRPNDLRRDDKRPPRFGLGRPAEILTIRGGNPFVWLSWQRDRHITAPNR